MPQETLPSIQAFEHAALYGLARACALERSKLVKTTETQTTITPDAGSMTLHVGTVWTEPVVQWNPSADNSCWQNKDCLKICQTSICESSDSKRRRTAASLEQIDLALCYLRKTNLYPDVVGAEGRALCAQLNSLRGRRFVQADLKRFLENLRLRHLRELGLRGPGRRPKRDSMSQSRESSPVLVSAAAEHSVAEAAAAAAAAAAKHETRLAMTDAMATD